MWSCQPWKWVRKRTTLRRPVAARAMRSARWVASVPEEVNRTRSADGTSAFTSCAQRTSPSWLDPKWVPRARASAMARSISGAVVSEQQGAVSPEVVHVLVAVHVPLARALGAVHVDRVGIDLPAVVGDPAREQLLRFGGKGGGAAGALAIGGFDPGIAESFHERVSVVSCAGRSSRPANGFGAEGSMDGVGGGVAVEAGPVAASRARLPGLVRYCGSSWSRMRRSAWKCRPAMSGRSTAICSRVLRSTDSGMVRSSPPVERASTWNIAARSR